jgi:hypothetical protein
VVSTGVAVRRIARGGLAWSVNPPWFLLLTPTSGEWHMTESTDRRAAERYPVNKDATCPFVSPVVEDFGPVKVRDVSMQGVGLITNRRVEVGALLTVVLANPARSFSKTVLARVVHITPMGGAFLAGCSFVTPLTYQEMTTLVL